MQSDIINNLKARKEGIIISCDRNEKVRMTLARVHVVVFIPLNEVDSKLFSPPPPP